MASGYACQRCSQLPPPPPIFSIGPPPNILSIEARCLSRSLSPSTIQTNKSTSSSSTTSSSLSIVLGILIAFLITFSTIVLIKKRLVIRRHKHKTGFNNTMKISCSSVKSNRYQNEHGNNNYNHHHHRHHHHHQLQNRAKFPPLLSDSCSSDQTSSTPPNEYPCTNGVTESLLSSSDGQHEYEQIKCDDSLSESLHYYCLIYCRQCANYHPTSSSSSSSSSSCPRVNLVRPYYLPLSTNPTCQHQCSCYHRIYYQRHDNRFFELQPMLVTKLGNNNSDDLTDPLKFNNEKSPA